MSEVRWYQVSAEKTLEMLEATTRGLSTEEAKARLSIHGYNEIVLKGRSMLVRLLDQFRSPLVWILLIAAIVTTVMSVLDLEDMWADTAVITGVVVLNVLLGFFQEGKAEAALEALKKMASQNCTVLRDGIERIIPSKELVPGDVVILSGGDKIPADLRLFFARDAYADEAPLTGESTPVGKDTVALEGTNISPGDQHCIAFSGTFLIRGSARGIVISTGDNTEFGKIAGLMKSAHIMQTPLQKKIAAFTQVLVIGIIGLGLINFIVGMIVGQNLIHMFMASVALIVAGMPEMLPMIVTGVLAMAATVMAKRNALIRRLSAAETLGCTTVICSDKTGTLTKNEMTVLMIYAGGKNYKVTGVGYEPAGEIKLDSDKENNDLSNKPDIELIETLRAGYLCNNASLSQEEGRYHIVGDPTEGALVVSAMKAGINSKSTRLDEIPFGSELMYMATLNQNEEDNIIYVKGSPEKIIDMCDNRMVGGHVIPINKDEVREKAAAMAREALRVLAMAYKKSPGDKRTISPDDLTGLVFLGLQGMIDPPRQEAIEAIKKCKRAGVRTVMITGDHAITAVAIARQLGILTGDERSVLTGEELFRMSDDDLFNQVDKVSVYARVAPEHKLRIAQQLQKRGHVVAMTGDGVNDAPALKAADIGIAMGITGTEVSKEASSMILTDDNFASIVAAIEEGRHAWKNLEKAILYTLPTNGGQMLLILGAILLAPFVPLFALRLPVEPIHILWVNLADSVFLTMPLLFEPKERGLLRGKPRNPKEKIANRLFFIRVGLVSLVLAATGFTVYWIFGQNAIDPETTNVINQAQTATLASIILLHLGYLLTARSVSDSAFTLNPFSNKLILAGITVSVLTLLAIIYVPFLQVVFKTTSFPLAWWPWVLLSLLPGFIIIEIEKGIRKTVLSNKYRRA
ncbi:MAG: HAD-IC family P-type ATPase [Dehalococcoidales bacterium]|nr:HAD-IC family P-type ATPase [Dehalococcoidales bacterium]